MFFILLYIYITQNALTHAWKPEKKETVRSVTEPRR
jgi:hypothetical protein